MNKEQVDELNSREQKIFEKAFLWFKESENLTLVLANPKWFRYFASRIIESALKHEDIKDKTKSNIEINRGRIIDKIGDEINKLLKIKGVSASSISYGGRYESVIALVIMIIALCIPIFGGLFVMLYLYVYKINGYRYLINNLEKRFDLLYNISIERENNKNDDYSKYQNDQELITEIVKSVKYVYIQKEH